MVVKNKDIINSMYAAQDKAYRDFQYGLIPGFDKNYFIGVRTPVLRKMAKDLVESRNINEFIKSLPHKFFEENQLHSFIICYFDDIDAVLMAVDEFLPYVDNWATCDQMSPKIFRKNPDKLLPYINKWIKSKHLYTVRFGILCLMRYFMNNNFDKKYINLVLNIKSKEYYINLMRAWYFATGAAKHFDEFFPCFKKLDIWTRNSAIQKAIESYRVNQDHKLKLRALKGIAHELLC